MSVPDQFDAAASRLEPDSADKYRQLLQKFEESRSSYWKFEIVPGCFKQSLAETDEFSFDYLKEDFGVIGSWSDIFAKLDRLNKDSGPNESYKVFFLARHGQGYHNLANAIYGQKAWDEKWSKMTGDGNIVWAPDPELTDLGVSQAKENASEWARQIEKGVRIPTRWFCSPFSRSADTLIYTWENIVDVKNEQPLIKEDFRETMGVHLCDKRSPRRTIAQKYEHQGFVIEDGFAEEDIYFKDDYREKVEEQAIRLNRGFQYIFDKCDDSVVNVTSHSGTIRCQLLVLNHRPFSIGTGGMIPVFVKGTKYTK